MVLPWLVLQKNLASQILNNKYFFKIFKSYTFFVNLHYFETFFLNFKILILIFQNFC